MARGTGAFDGTALRRVRTEQGMSAQKLARRVGTTKAMVLAYEAGRTTPEAGRAAALATALDVPTAALVTGAITPPVNWTSLLEAEARRLQVPLITVKHLLPTPHTRWRKSDLPAEPGIRRLRQEAGLLASQAAAAMGISVSTYREIETLGRLPTRGHGRFYGQIAMALSSTPQRVELSLRLHPQAIERALAVSRHVRAQFERARTTPAYQPDLQAPDVLEIARLLKQPPATISRVLQYEVVQYRRLLRQRAEAQARDAFPVPDDHWSSTSHLRQARQLIAGAPERAAARLTWDLPQALTAQQWQGCMRLLFAGYAPGEYLRELDRDDADLMKALRYRASSSLPALIMVEESPAGGRRYRVPRVFFHFCQRESEYYRYLHPTVFSPSAPAAYRDGGPQFSRPMAESYPPALYPGSRREEHRPWNATGSSLLGGPSIRRQTEQLPAERPHTLRPLPRTQESPEQLPLIETPLPRTAAPPVPSSATPDWQLPHLPTDCVPGMPPGELTKEQSKSRMTWGLSQGWTQRRIARFAGCSAATVNRYRAWLGQEV